MVYTQKNGALVASPDHLAIEEPLEIRLDSPEGPSTLSVTMRTPGHDFELVTGFLLAEGVVDRREDIRRVAYCMDPDLDTEQRFNVVTAELTVPPGRASVARHVLTSSSCGVCGSASIEAVRLGGHPTLPDGPKVSAAMISRFPGLLRAGQRAFASTGGLHGVALMSPAGDVLVLREDVGRHNAVDKVLGCALLDGGVALSESVLVVSGRISFEIVQKALRSGVPMVVAVSAATSLAARLAGEFGMTLVGFVRDDRFVVYAGRERIISED
jgi:FdhD protein